MIKNLHQLAPYLADEDKARDLFERIRWPHGPVCPHCHEGETIYKVKSKKARKGLYKCGACKKQFTATINTIFQGSHIPLSKWLYAIYLMCASKKGVSARQLQRELGLTYKSAWFMCHRVRYAMTQPPLIDKMGGSGSIVEVDETYIGGKRKNNKHKGYKPKKKPIVATIIEREGSVRTFPIPRVTLGPMTWLVGRNVRGDTDVMTDGHKAYNDLHEFFDSHQVVDHSQEYVRGIVHTNFAESYHSLLKRGIFGTFHHVSEKHLPRYLREFEHRWNGRRLSDGELTVQAIQGANGKRMSYKRPISRVGRPAKIGGVARKTDAGPALT